MKDTKIVKNSLKELKKCTNMGTLYPSINRKNNIVTLKDLNNDINNFQKVRLAVLKEAKINLLMALKEYDFDLINFNFEQIFENGYLALDFQDEEYHAHCLFGENGLVEASSYDDWLLKRTNIITSEIKTLLKLNEESNILNNSFYNDTYLEVKPLPFRFLINGSGISLSISDLESLGYNRKMQEEIFHYFARNYNGILKKILVDDDLELDKYRTENKSKILEKYRSMR